MIEAILIDDDELIRESWKLIFELNDAKCFAFDSYEAFSASDQFNATNLPLFIDVDFHGEILGPGFAAKAFERGFKEIYICTGYDENAIDRQHFIRKVISKDPPEWLFKR